MISTIHYKAADAEKVLSTIEKEIEEIGKAGEKKPKNNKSKNTSKKKKETVKYYNQEENTPGDVSKIPLLKYAAL